MNGGKDTAIIDRIMQKFRPIAPKPAIADGGGGSGSGQWRTGDKNKGITAFGKRRKKRKYVRFRKLGISNDNDNINSKRNGSLDQEKVFKFEEKGSDHSGDVDRTVGKDPSLIFLDRTAVAESWITVESVFYFDDVAPIDQQTLANLEDDTCPVFVTDKRLDRVEWVNEAYKRVLGINEREGLREVRVSLVVKEGLRGLLRFLCSCPSFTCWVRLEYCSYDYTWQQEGKTWRMVPCDVWRMDEFVGRFAWRLDVKAALGLGMDH